MDFGFNVNELLTKKINKVTHILIPEDFRGDKQELRLVKYWEIKRHYNTFT